jgi:hypothetical protein
MSLRLRRIRQEPPRKRSIAAAPADDNLQLLKGGPNAPARRFVVSVRSFKGQ